MNTYTFNLSERKGPAKVFISYSHKDEKFKDQLITHLSPLKERGLITEWHDRLLDPGVNVFDMIDKNIEDSNVILLLISAYYIQSYFCFKDELPKALKKWNDGSALVVPIIVRPVANWHSLSFGKQNALPTDGKAITKWSNRDAAFVDVCEHLSDLIIKQIQPNVNFGISSKDKDTVNDINIYSSLNQYRQYDSIDVFPDLGGSFIRRGRNDFYTIRINSYLTIMPNTQYFNIKEKDSVQSVLNQIYVAFQDNLNIYTYLDEWILQNSKTKENMVIHEIAYMIPAQFVFLPNSEWNLYKLNKEYSPRRGNERY